MRDKVFFAVGDLVTLKQDLPNKPVMMVRSIDKSVLGGEPKLIGVTCTWFTVSGEIQKGQFSTKDLKHV